MKFGENLQKLRKENKMSQEQLAEKLNVSRQAVSKWESNQSYPETDKIIAIAKIFNCSMDELVNSPLEKKIQPKQERKTFNEYKDDILDFIKRCVCRLGKMNSKEFIQCILFVFLVIFLLYVCKLPVNYIKGLGDNLFNLMPYIIGEIFKGVWTIIIDLSYLIIAVIAFVYIFKIKYLDNFEEVEENTVNEVNSEMKSEKDCKVIDNYHSMSFLEFLSKLILYFIKFIAVLISLPFIFGLIFLIFCLFISIVFLFKKVLYFGIFIALLGSTSLSIVFIYILYSFVLNNKTNLKKLFIWLISSIIVLGIGGGLATLEIADSSYVDKAPSSYKLVSDTHTYEMNENLLDNFSHYNIIYQEDNTLTDNVKIKIEYYKDFFEYKITLNGNNLEISSNSDDMVISKISKALIKDLQTKEYHNYSKLFDYTVTVITSKENIEKLQASECNNERRLDEIQIENYENKISELEDKIDSLNAENENLKDSYETRIEDYKEKIQNYKDSLSELE